ncbi:uncharacterized protein LOC126613705 [Malus sylvestris]|uniref:uncharacterized protein LOC126613705 n=1 Tax=Malus sylvestris TaxID=3752 RepID=UPI0021AC5D56|nr:uncharacterized protein LOC126613705 [Malus sylvestris]
MPDIDPEVACHKLHVDPAAKPVIQNRRHFAPERVTIIEVEIDKLLEAGFIEKVAYSLLNFLDAYFGYNQIAMYEPDKEKTVFVIERGTYCYKVMLFSLNNAGATYQMLVNMMFKKQIGLTIEKVQDEAQPHQMHIWGIFRPILRVFSNPMRNRSTSQANLSNLRDEVSNHLEGDPKLDWMSGPQPLPMAVHRSMQAFFKAIKRAQQDEWDEECERAFQDLKK